jgi:hypothetical protein
MYECQILETKAQIEVRRQVNIQRVLLSETTNPMNYFFEMDRLESKEAYLKDKKLKAEVD